MQHLERDIATNYLETLARQPTREETGPARQIENRANAGGVAQRSANCRSFARVSLLAFRTAETVNIAILGNLRAAVELALVVVAIFPRPAWITLAGTCLLGRHFNRLAKARKRP